jgi:hypothetical protein
VYLDPWSDINEYPMDHSLAIQTELRKELSIGHMLKKLDLEILAKREDRDDILVRSGDNYFIVHLTWSAKAELSPYPTTEFFKTVKELETRLMIDSECS